MKKYFTTKRFSAISVIIVIVIMQITFFYNSGIPNSPMIEFEFVNNQLDVEAIFGGFNNYDENIISALLEFNDYDIIFMIAYSAFLILLFSSFYKIKANKIFLVAVFLAVIAGIFDFLENIQLNQIMFNTIIGENYIQNIALLKIFTWIKWFALALTFAISYFGLSYKSKYVKLAALLLFAPLILSVIAFITKDIAIEQVFVLTIMASFAFFLIRTLVVKDE